MPEERDDTSAGGTPREPSQSPADRIVALFSDELGEDNSDADAGTDRASQGPGGPARPATAAAEGGEGEGEDSSTQPPPPGGHTTLKVRVDGQEVEVPAERVDAAVAALGDLGIRVTREDVLRGYSFASHNTRTAQRLGEERKALEAEAREVRELRERYLATLPKLEEYVQRGLDEFASVDWDALRREDPARFAELKAAHLLQQERLAAVRAEREAEEQRLAVERQKEFAQYVAQEAQLALERIPEWRDEKVRAEELQAIARYATETLGFEPTVLQDLYDHRVYVALRKAYLYDRMAADARTAREKVGEARKTVAAGPRKSETGDLPERFRQARTRLGKTGRVEDAAAAIEAALFAGVEER